MRNEIQGNITTTKTYTNIVIPPRNLIVFNYFSPQYLYSEAF